jgi:THO complex subunit 1 transcription elongation factor.
MPVVLLGDIFDALTLDRCETLFAFVENGVNTWREEMFFSACKNNLLRMCNGKMDINTKGSVDGIFSCDASITGFLAHVHQVVMQTIHCS